jgi:hypothetical protein
VTLSNNSERGGLLLSTLIILTLLATLAAGLARVQGSRGDMAAEFALGAALDDLNRAGLNLALNGLRATLCQPSLLSGAVPDSEGRFVLSRTITGEGSFTLRFCSDQSACYASDWWGAANPPPWVVTVVGTLGDRTKTVKAGVTDQGLCAATVIEVWDPLFTLSHQQ